MHKSPLSTISYINPPLPRKVGDDELVSFVGMQDVSEYGSLRLSDPVSFGSVKSGFTRFVENDVLFAKITPCMENGKGAIASGLSNFIGCGSTEFHVLRANEYGSHKFIFHVTKSDEFRQKAEMNMTGSAGQRRVPSCFFKEFPVYIPEKSEQEKIAHVLTTVDNLIEKTQALIDKYTAVKQGMMHDLFTRGIDLATGQLRPSYEQAPELYKETELGWVPREWGVVTIADFASDDKNAIVDGPFGSNLKTEHYRKSGVPVIQSGFVTSNRFQANEYLYVDNEKFISEIRSKVLPGDIVMAKIGAQCGTCAMLPEGHPVGILAGNCLKITVGKDNSKEFLEALLHYYKFIGRLDLVVTTTAQPAVSMSSLKKMKIKRPELAEQNMIMNDIYSIDSVIDREKRAEGHFLELKKGLMQDLLTGRVRVMQGVSNGE